MGVTIGFRKNLEAEVPKLIRDVAQREARLRRDLEDTLEDRRWLTALANAAGVNVPQEIYLIDGTAHDDEQEQAA